MNPVAVKPHVPPKSGLLFYWRLFLNLFSGYPYIVSSHYSSVFEKKLLEIIRDDRPDLIICEWTPYAVFVEKIREIKRLIVAHNVETQIWQRYYNNEKNPFKKWYIGVQKDKLERFERSAFRYVDAATAVSAVDEDAIHSLNHHLPVKVVDNGVDLEYFRAGDEPSSGCRLVFVGTMDWRPNQDAVRYFVSDIYPLVKKRIPEAEVVFVGRNPPDSISSLDGVEGVTVTGSVDDVRPYIQGSSVYIVPLRIGGGTRLKILDALAMKKAVVSTSVGAEGLEVSDSRDIMLADTPEQFADKIEQLIRNPEFACRLGENGRRLVEEHYDWDRLASKLERFLAEIVKGK
jgi:glycosyltransferase involved in cell wall biosynthesis